MSPTPAAPKWFRDPAALWRGFRVRVVALAVFTGIAVAGDLRSQTRSG